MFVKGWPTQVGSRKRPRLPTITSSQWERSGAFQLRQAQWIAACLCFNRPPSSRPSLQPSCTRVVHDVDSFESFEKSSIFLFLNIVLYFSRRKTEVRRKGGEEKQTVALSITSRNFDRISSTRLINLGSLGSLSSILSRLRPFSSHVERTYPAPNTEEIN